MIGMMTYKRLRGYDIDILNKILNSEKEVQKKYLQNNELDHYRMSLKTINKIENVIKEKIANRKWS